MDNFKRTKNIIIIVISRFVFDFSIFLLFIGEFKVTRKLIYLSGTEIFPFERINYTLPFVIEITVCQTVEKQEGTRNGRSNEWVLL